MQNHFLKTSYLFHTVAAAGKWWRMAEGDADDGGSSNNKHTWAESRSSKNQKESESSKDLCGASKSAQGLHMRSINWVHDCVVDVRARGTITASSAGHLGRITYPKEQKYSRI
jgi:hypothetical protein